VLGEADDVAHRGDRGEGRYRHPHRGQPLAHDDLVLRVPESRRAGAMRAPSASSASSRPPGTCSWSKVTTSQPAAKDRRSSSEVCSPSVTPFATSAALSWVASASTRRDRPSAIDAWCVIRDSCPRRPCRPRAAPSLPRTPRS
jgi:hypothetical protein